MLCTPEPKPAGSPASQAFCTAKPWRRRNSLPPSMSNHRRVSAQRARTHKKATTSVVAFLWWTRSDSNRRPPQCECGALPAALLAHNSAYWRNIFIIAQLPPLCNAKNCTNLAVICPDCISRTALRAFADSPLRSLPSPSPGTAPSAVPSTPSEGYG